MRTLLLLALLLPFAAAATESALLRLGPSGIHCVKAPCPWRAIVAVDAESEPALFYDAEVPEIVASEADRAAVLAAWEDFACLLVVGRLEEGTLYVERVVGACEEE